jgi:D-alanyl-D-alanine carboxypeptidase
MGEMRLQARIDRLVDREVGRGECHEAVLCLMHGDASFAAAAGEWCGSRIGADTPFLAASVSKLLVTAMIFRLAGEGRFVLDDPLQAFFAAGELDRLHVWAGEDLTPRITLRHLLTHSSGLPDYFEDRRRDGTRLVQMLLEGHDVAFDLPKVLEWVRWELVPHFPPGARRKARYADTNFFLLAEVIRRVTGGSLDVALESLISRPLGLARTRYFHPGTPTLPLRSGSKVLSLPLALSSMPGEGGAVSTARELSIFVRSFFAGKLFDSRMLSQLPDWRRIFFPLQAGTGVIRFHHPAWLPPFRSGLEFLGHSGSVGSFAFYCPARDLVVAGTVNQIHGGRSRPFRMIVRAALAFDTQFPQLGE